MSLSTQHFVFRLTLCLAFAAPTGYVACISAVAVHELFGHGALALLLGGTFEGFALMPDGMGWAAAHAPNYQNLVLAGGVVSGVLFGAVMTGLSTFITHPLGRATLLLFAACSFFDAIPYAFWNSVFPRPPGDFGRILMDIPSGLLRWSFVVTFGIAYLVVTIGLNLALFRTFGGILGTLTRHQVALVAFGVFGCMGALVWFAFDWDQVIENVGRLPQFVGAGLQFAVAPILLASRQRVVTRTSISATSWAFAIISAWVAAIALFVALTSWLQYGVYWSA